MIRFYWDRVLELPWLLFESFTTIEGLIAVAAFIAMFFSPEIGRHWAGWKTFNRKWAIAVVAIHLAFLTLQSNYRAFIALTSDKDALIQAADQKAIAAGQELARVETLMKQLTIENAALQNNAPVMTDPQARIAAVREQLVAHADKAPTKEQFTVEAADEWHTVAYGMVERTIDPSKSDLGIGYFDNDKPTYKDLQRIVGALRGIAINLTEGDLRDNAYPQQR